MPDPWNLYDQKYSYLPDAGLGVTRYAAVGNEYGSFLCCMRQAQLRGCCAPPFSVFTPTPSALSGPALWVRLHPPNPYVEVLTPSTHGCDLI